MFETCRALPDADIDIYATRVVSKGFFPSGARVRIGDLHGWYRARVAESTTYDIYLQYRTTRTAFLLGERLCAKLKLVVPCGNPVGGAEIFFDYVLNETDDGVRYVKDRGKSITVPPPVTRTTGEMEEVKGLPSRYFLTVFNPYSLDRPYSDGIKPYKGYDILYWVAPQLRYPLVWAYSDATFNYPEARIRKTCNLILRRNLSQEEIAYLYEHAAGYVCFSREEGFGWSVADAMLRGLPIFSRHVGVVTLFGRDTHGFNIYETGEELAGLLNGDHSTGRVEYCTDLFAPERFRRALFDLCAASPE